MSFVTPFSLLLGGAVYAFWRRRLSCPRAVGAAICTDLVAIPSLVFYGECIGELLAKVVSR